MPPSTTAAAAYWIPRMRGVGRRVLQTLFVVAAGSDRVYAISQPPPSRTRTRKPPMSIDFEVPAEAKAIREKVRKWVQEECIPAEKELDTKPLDEVLGKLRAKARAQGLWCPFVPKQYGGMGLGPLANAPVQMELGG